MPLIMLHGASSCRGAFAPQINSFLSDRFRLIAIDLPGHGDTDDMSPEVYTVEGMVDVVEDVINRMKLRSYAILGWSFGGYVAMQLAMRDPRVSGLILSGCPPLRPGLWGFLAAFTLSTDGYILLRTNYGTERARELTAKYFDGQCDEHLRMKAVRTDKNVKPVFLKSVLRESDINHFRFIQDTELPVCFLNGNNDPFFKHEFYDRLKIQRLYTKQIIRVPMAGHAPFWTNPSFFNGIVNSFLTEEVIARSL